MGMVEKFGSLAAAFYELEREARMHLKPPLSNIRGEISRSAFNKVVHERMKLFDLEEVRLLFSFIINADVIEHDEGGIATYSHFGVTDDEWKTVVQQKELESSGL